MLSSVTLVGLYSLSLSFLCLFLIYCCESGFPKIMSSNQFMKFSQYGKIGSK